MYASMQVCRRVRKKVGLKSSVIYTDTIVHPSTAIGMLSEDGY